MGLPTAVSKSAKVFVACAAALLSANVNTPAYADEAMTAGSVNKRLSNSEWTLYVAGIIEGLAYARYVKDGKQPEGRECVYNWFYKDDTSVRRVHAAFEKYPDADPGHVVGLLVAAKCGA